MSTTRARSGWLTIAAGAMVAASSLTIAAGYGDDGSAWRKDREVRFAAYRTVHPTPDAEIAAVKAKTAALIAAAPPIDAGPGMIRPPVVWRASDTPLELWDAADVPEMIVVPAGEFTMGSPVTEARREPREGPRHRVRIGYTFAVSKYLVTVGEFEQFVTDAGYDAGDICHTDEAGDQPKSHRNWRQPSFDQTRSHPAVCVNWIDAQAYVAWLSKATGHAYRLLTEAEYEHANRAGSVAAYWWGDDPDAACTYANSVDRDTQASFPTWAANNCHDGYAFTSPVGRFTANAFGLSDMTGNAWSWVSDCWNDSYAGAPTDGSANIGGDCGWRMLRGGAWGRYPWYLRSAKRGKDVFDNRIYNNGFRVARTL